MSNDHQPADLAATAAPPSRTKPPAGEVSAHLACVGCGYDLHGLSAARPCPECGIPVALTLRASNDAAWLSNVRSGVQSLLFGHYLMLVSLLVWPIAPISLCFALLLQVGSAIDLATRHADDATPKSRLGFLIALIAGGVCLYVVSIITMLNNFSLGLALFTFGAALHAAGTAIAWSRFRTVMKRGISTGLATAGRWLARGSAAMAMLLSLLAPCVWWLGLSGSTVNASRTVLIILLIPSALWLLASLVALHAASRATRRLVAQVGSAPTIENHTSAQIGGDP